MYAGQWTRSAGWLETFEGQQKKQLWFNSSQPCSMYKPMNQLLTISGMVLDGECGRVSAV
jgi:hypothetical protein